MLLSGKQPVLNCDGMAEMHAKLIRLHGKSAQIRLRAIKAQLSAGFTLCNLFEIDPLVAILMKARM
jgi:hypothetical protein